MHSRCCITGFAIWIGLAAALASSVYTKAMFAKGLKKGGFVFITLHDSKTASDHRVCVLENMLLGAIHMQHHLDFDERGRNNAEQLALKFWNQPFVFSDPKAFRNVKPEYTPQQVDEIRKQLSKYDRRMLSKQLDDPYGAIHDLYTHPYRESHRDAVAHVLLENGIAVGVDDRTPMLLPLDD